MTVLVAGSIVPDSGFKTADPTGLDTIRLVLSYGVRADDDTYRVRVESARLSVVLHRSEHGWIASEAGLNALGYGESQADAINDLCDSVEQYLRFLREDKPGLAEEVAHHTAYVQLLDAPRAVWVASVDAPTVE